MTPSRVALIPLVPLLLATACTSYKLTAPDRAVPALGTDFPASQARVCVLRTSVLAQAVTFPTRDDGVLVGATRGPTYFCYLAEPGPHDIAIEADEVEHAQIEAVAGRSYYLKQEVDNVFGYVKCRAVWVDEAAAKELLEQSTYEVLSGVPGSDALPPNPPFAPARKGPPLSASR